MAQTKSIKKALLASLLSIVICFTMLIGSTFAWFTDTVTVGVNTVQSGELKVSFQKQLADGSWVDTEGETLDFIADDGRANDEILWEPGATYKLPNLKIVNKGSLAFKYYMRINGLYGDLKLADVLDVMITVDGQTYNAGTLSELMVDPDGVAYGIILPAGKTVLTDATEADKKITVSGETKAYTIALHMQKEANNDYQNLTLSGMTFNVAATQYTYESDSFNNEYDEKAEYPIINTKVNNEIKLEAALENGDENIVLEEDIVISKTYALPENSETTIYGNGHTITRDADNLNTIFEVPATSTLELDDVKLDGGAEKFEIDMSGYPSVVEESLADIVKTKEPAIVSYGTLIADGATFENNYADGYNSSVRVLAGTADFNDCTFSHNYSPNQGAAVGVGVDRSNVTEYEVKKVTFNNCIFKDNITNKGGAGGGALYVVNTEEVYIQSCEFINNCGMSYNCGGGAIFFGRNGSYSIQNSMKDDNPDNDLKFTKAYIDDCLFKGNRSGNDGAAIHSESADLYITNSKFIENYGHSGSSSVGTVSCMPYAADGKNPPIFLNCSIDNCEFTGNSLGGGAVFGNHATAVILKLTNTIIKDNKGTSDLLIYEGDNLIENCQFVEKELTKAVFDIRTVDERYADVIFKDVTIETAENIPAIMLDAQKGLNATCHIQGTTTADMTVKTTSGVSKVMIEGVLNGDITLDANTPTENIVVEQGATHNGAVTKNQ